MENVIYCIRNIKNNLKYIGSAVKYKYRINIHKSQLRNSKHHSIFLQRAWNKYQEENFEFYVLEFVDKNENLIKREQWWIDCLNPKYNICKIAGSSLGIKRRKESIEKMIISKTGLKHSEQARLNKSIAQGGVNHYNYGKTLSEETKIKKSLSMKEFFKNNAHHSKGKPTYLSKEALSAMAQKHMIPIYQYSRNGIFIKEWDSATTAGKNLKIFNSNITSCLKGHIKTAGKYIWKYKKLKS